jgi:hypothetical protein
MLPYAFRKPSEFKVTDGKWGASPVELNKEQNAGAAMPLEPSYWFEAVLFWKGCFAKPANPSIPNVKRNCLNPAVLAPLGFSVLPDRSWCRVMNLKHLA